MKKISIINTGGTFNKVYNPKNGTLEIDKTSKSLEDIAQKWLCTFEIINIIGKDSLDITPTDRDTILHTIQKSDTSHILIVHGTDTIDITARYLANATLDKIVVLTGAMVPYSIDSLEATANFASAYGYLHALEKHGVYIAMNGVLGNYTQITKNRNEGRFSFISDKNYTQF